MVRAVNDQDYVAYLPSDMYRNRYMTWKETVLPKVDSVVAQLHQDSVENVMNRNGLTPRDIALMVRLGYFTLDEVEVFGLGRIENAVPM